MSAPAKRPCLLLVDDTPTNIQILVGLLRADYELKVATNGAQALKICEQTPHIDLVLLDIMMPEMDGYEVCQRLRADPATKEIPIIFLTAKTETEDVVRGFETGANDYVAKPFRPPELLSRVKTHLTLRTQQAEIERKNTELKEMLHILCHDVANHFAVVNMSLELYAVAPERGIDHRLPNMTAAVRNGMAMTGLVRAMRQLEDKMLLLDPVSLSQSMREALLLADSRLQEKKLSVSLEMPDDVKVVAEPTALTNSVFGNVLSNAAKFSLPGSTIEIRVQVDGDTVCVRIRDRGIGMPPEVLATLFDVGKSHSRLGTAGEKGTGFGMPLMHKFVTQFGGFVEVTSRDQAHHPDDHGTEFTIRLKSVKT